MLLNSKSPDSSEPFVCGSADDAGHVFQRNLAERTVVIKARALQNARFVKVDFAGNSNILNLSSFWIWIRKENAGDEKASIRRGLDDPLAGRK